MMELGKEITRVAENLAPAREDNKPTEIIDFNLSRAERALKDKLIKDCTEDELKVKIKLVYSMVGLRPQHYPTDQEKQDLHDYIFLKYGNKTLVEFVLAFDLAINNELDLRPEDVKVYDQFTIAYLASIMTAYKKWLYNQSKIAAQRPVVAALSDKKELTLEEKKTWIEEWKQLPAIEINYKLIPTIFYEYLTSTELLVSKKAKRDYVAIAAEQIKSELTGDAEYYEFLKMEKDGFSGKVKDRIIFRAQRLIVYDFLTVKKFSLFIKDIPIL